MVFFALLCTLRGSHRSLQALKANFWPFAAHPMLGGSNRARLIRFTAVITIIFPNARRNIWPHPALVHTHREHGGSAPQADTARPARRSCRLHTRPGGRRSGSRRLLFVAGWRARAVFVFWCALSLYSRKEIYCAWSESSTFVSVTERTSSAVSRGASARKVPNGDFLALSLPLLPYMEREFPFSFRCCWCRFWALFAIRYMKAKTQ